MAKRVADAVRSWIHQHAPDESIPGDNKNDRLFDTWQEYGCIQPNPHTGQAVWYVVVHGKGVAEAAASEGVDEAQGASEEGGTYSHSLTMLRFPLARLYDDPAQYPPEMSGHIEIKDKRPRKNQDAADEAAEAPRSGSDDADSVLTSEHEPAAGQASADTAADTASSSKVTAAGSMGASSKPKPAGPKPIRAPEFNQPKAAAAKAKQDKAGSSTSKAKETAAVPASSVAPGHTQAPARKPTASPANEITIGGGIDGFDADDDAWLDDDDDVRVAVKAQPPKPAPVRNAASKRHKPVAAPIRHETAAMPTTKPDDRRARPKVARPEPVAARAVPEPPSAAPDRSSDRVVPAKAQAQPKPTTTRRPASEASHSPEPVVLTPRLPELPQQAASRKAEPSELALAFIQWLQQGLAGREIKYNEAGAPVHFTAEGMALVSPLIFKQYAAETGPAAQADIFGLQVQREVLKAGWHLMVAAKVNIVRYEVVGRGGVPVSKLSAVVLTDPERFVLPVPPVNPVLKLV